ncbi:hypothetical protein [Streptomyces melanogenes]|uniref:hypothetical protein n=1 Tax=Streptomyces melanogenes TaxID=67326 RepID=UPI0037A5D4DE
MTNEAPSNVIETSDISINSSGVRPLRFTAHHPIGGQLEGAQQGRGCAAADVLAVAA